MYQFIYSFNYLSIFPSIIFGPLPEMQLHFPDFNQCCYSKVEPRKPCDEVVSQRLFQCPVRHSGLFKFGIFCRIYKSFPFLLEDESINAIFQDQWKCFITFFKKNGLCSTYEQFKVLDVLPTVSFSSQISQDRQIFRCFSFQQRQQITGALQVFAMTFMQ